MNSVKPQILSILTQGYEICLLENISFHFIHLQEKVKYYDIATEKRAEFEKARIEYNKKKVHLSHVFPLAKSFYSHG